MTNDAEQGKRWRWRWLKIGDGWDGLTVCLASTAGIWKSCEYYCSWNDGAETSRGKKGVAHEHEHLEYEQLISGWGYDASGLDVEDDIMGQILREHETAQRAEGLLRALEQLVEAVDVEANDSSRMPISRELQKATNRAADALRGAVTEEA